MTARGLVALLAVAVTLVALPSGARPRPVAKRVLVSKAGHTMDLLDADGELLGRYTVSLGPGGAGPKRREGDRVTPVGRYHVTMHQPSESFRIFLRLDYPNAADRARFAEAKRRGELPPDARIGGDIGIHGGTSPVRQGADWTLGCVAVADDEIVEIAKLVPPGTVVDVED